MVMAYAGGRVGLAELLHAWALVYVGNFIGAVGIAVLVFMAEGYSHGGGTVGATALAAAQSKASFSIFQGFVHGILGNTLVCLATWLCYSARTTTDKILAIVPPIAAFSAAGFEHSIANMHLLSFALLTKFGASTAFWDAIGQSPSTFESLTLLRALQNLLSVTLGNMVGGVLVGITYWFIYLRKQGVK